jgi:hypothetical protein
LPFILERVERWLKPITAILSLQIFINIAT